MQSSLFSLKMSPRVRRERHPSGRGVQDPSSIGFIRRDAKWFGLLGLLLAVFDCASDPSGRPNGTGASPEDLPADGVVAGQEGSGGADGATSGQESGGGGQTGTETHASGGGGDTTSSGTRTDQGGSSHVGTEGGEAGTTRGRGGSVTHGKGGSGGKGGSRVGKGGGAGKNPSDESGPAEEVDAGPLLEGACRPNLTFDLPIAGGKQPTANPLGRSEVCVAISGELQNWGCTAEADARTINCNGKVMHCANTPDKDFPEPLADGYRYFHIGPFVVRGDASANVGFTGGVWWIP